MPSNFLVENYRLRTSQIFEGLPAEERKKLMDSAVTHLYEKGQVIFREGGIPTGIYYVKSGMVKKFKNTSKGGEQIYYICGEGELIGYHALLSEGFYPDSAATIQDSEIAFIPKENFLQLLHNSTALSNGLLKALGLEFTLFINSITNLATKSVRERLAYTLLILEEKFKASSGVNSIQILISRTDLANMVGTAKETVVRHLLEFKNAGLIDKTGRSIRILNRKRMIKEANLVAVK